MASDTEVSISRNTPEPPTFTEDEDNNPFSHQGGISGFINQDEEGGEESLLLGNSRAVNDTVIDVPINVESRVTKLLKPSKKVKIEITEAGNSNEGMVNSSKKYVVYTIKLINCEDIKEEVLTRRRYSDFESLRDILTKIFPLIIIPPIPPKNYLNLTVLNGLVSQAQSIDNGNGNSNNGDTNGSESHHPQSPYSYINSTHLAKNKLIEHRKRLLANFLNNCLKIPRIRNLQFFAKFLDPNANWTDETVLMSSQLPKSIYLSNPENGLKTDPIYANLPNPSNGPTMSFFKDNRKRITKKILNGDSTANGTSSHLSSSSSQGQTNGNGNGNGNAVIEKTTNSKYIINTSGLDEINKRIMANYMGLSNDYADLGTIFNSFSLALSESSKEGKNSKANVVFDKVGQAFDRSYITINGLIGDLETKFSEPLGEAVQYSSILQFITKYQNRKLRQKELLDLELKSKKKELSELLHTEEESGRIENAVNSDPQAKDTKYNLDDAIAKDSNNKKTPPEPTSTTITTTSTTSTSRFRFPSLKKITQYVSEIIDQNPEQTRRQRISVLQEKIKIFEKCQNIMLEDISYITDEVNKDFQAFHKEQLKMIYEILLCYNRFLTGWAKKNIEIWEEIKEEVYKL
ncbi:uncharacterized protein RJT21DRAFT_82627 [Scheffersomyces amazonensis]|uniref:uncharacterized protein n=1 Tax=Scheffersomyces amazonensis TaxID=1078765 RepID=UPI00315DAB77